MTKVTMEYLQANGRYRRAVALTESQWPNFLINHTDKQAHSLMDSPVFSLPGKTRSFTKWEEFVEATPPEAQPFLDKLICVCEDQNIWPVSNEIMPDVQDRQMQFKEFAQDAEQNAVAAATRSAANNALMSAWSIVSLGIFTIVAAVILMLALQSDLAKQFMPSAALPFLISGIKMPRFKRTPKPKKEKVQKIKKERFKDFEILRVYDELSGFAWSCSMPLKVLSANLPLECRYTQELGRSRYIAMILFGGAILGMGFSLFYGAGAPLLLSFIGPMLLSTLGLAFGWIKGYQMFMLPPIWIVRRVFKQIEVAPGHYQVDYESMPEIIPEMHTKLNNMPLPMAQASRRAEVEEIIKKTQDGNTATAVLTRQNLASAYTPRIWRAYVLYEMLRGRDIRAKMRGPGTRSDKLQKISMAGMALGSLGILIVALLLLG